MSVVVTKAMGPIVHAVTRELPAMLGAVQQPRIATDEEETSRLLAPLLGRHRGAASLAAALDENLVTGEIATRCRRAMNAAGVMDKTLAKKLDDILGLTSQDREFDVQWIATLAKEVKAKGMRSTDGPCFNRAC